MIKLPPLDLYAGNTADRNSTNFPKRANALAYVDTETDAFYVHVFGAWHGLGGGIPEPTNDDNTYGRQTTTGGVSSWVAVVPAGGGQFSGNVGFGVSPTVPLHTLGETRHEFSSGQYVAFTDSGSGTSRIAARNSSDVLHTTRLSAADLTIAIGADTGIGSESIRTYFSGGVVNIGFFGATPVAQQTAVKATTALQNLGLGTSLTDYVAATGGTFSGALAVSSGGLTVEGGAVFNESGADVDHRWESDGNANMLFIDGGNNRVGVGTNSPGNFMHVVSSDTHEIIRMQPGSGLSDNPYFSFYNIAGTRLGFLQANTTQSDFRFVAENSMGFSIITGSSIRVSVGAAGGMTVGSPTGGNKGAGTINAQAVYDDNVLLTDYILDLYYDGKMSVEDRALHPNARLWSIEETAVFTEANHHLPTMPGRKEWEKGSKSVGELVTALWETVEQQQLQIFELSNKLKAVKNG